MAGKIPPLPTSPYGPQNFFILSWKNILHKCFVFYTFRFCVSSCSFCASTWFPRDKLSVGCSTEAMLGPTPSCLLYVISTVLLVLYYYFLCLEQLQYVLPEDQFYFLYISQSICHVYKVVPVSLEKSVSSSNCFFVLFLDYFSFIVCF